MFYTELKHKEIRPHVKRQQWADQKMFVIVIITLLTVCRMFERWYWRQTNVANLKVKKLKITDKLGIFHKQIVFYRLSGRRGGFLWTRRWRVQLVSRSIVGSSSSSASCSSGGQTLAIALVVQVKLHLTVFTVVSIRKKNSHDVSAPKSLRFQLRLMLVGPEERKWIERMFYIHLFRSF